MTESFHWQIFQPVDPEAEEEALKTTQILVRTIYADEEAAVEVTPVVATVATGTGIEGVGGANADGLVVAATEVAQPTPPRRKPPPPRRKKNKGEQEF